MSFTNVSGLNNSLNDFLKYVAETDIELRQQELLSKHTTWKVGGPADALVIIRNEVQLRTILKLAHLYNIKWQMIGRGSNLLALDAGFRGLIIKLTDLFTNIEFNDTQVIAGSACSMVNLATSTVKKQLTGLEFAVGIPGNVGGAVFMNAGAHGSEIANVFISADLMSPKGDLFTWTKSQFAFKYRYSLLQEQPAIVLKAKFMLYDAIKDEHKAKISHYREHRRTTQPVSYPCAGSVFRNPKGHYAGKLIEQAGLKGYKYGDAEISLIHGNFLVNRGQAKASDILNLIFHIQQTVKERFNIELIPEIRILEP